MAVNLTALAQARGKRSLAFSQRLQKLSKAAPHAVDRIAKDVFIAAVNGIVTGSPVDTGRLRAGWNPSVGTPDTEVPAKGAGTYLPAEAVIAEAVNVAESAPSSPKLILTNAVEYAGILEVGGFVPSDPGPSRDPREGRKGYVLVSGGYSTKATSGLLVKGLGPVAATLKRYESAARSLLQDGAK